MNLRKAVIVRPPDAHPVVKKAVQVLSEEIAKRTGIVLQAAAACPEGVTPIVLSIAPGPGPEGFVLEAKNTPTPSVSICGHDERGVLYGVGRLLRRLNMEPGVISLEAPLRFSTAPKHPVRGHQLGYRPVSNTYEAWTPEQFDQYIRELALFGANGIEIVPAGTDKDDTPPGADTRSLMKYTHDEMLVRLPGIIHSYGMDTWLWWPNMGPEEKLAERERIFGLLPHLDHLFIPGGDPGELEPDVLFTWAGKVAEALHKHHPKAGLWLSLQAFHQSDAWIDTFLDKVAEEPAWLTGLVFAPWQKMPFSELRKRVPARYPIRHYPDIGHCINCQYPVPNWDTAFAMTLGREGINPRPEAHKRIHNLHEGFSCGSLTYSEGVNDDVNKFVWTDQDWDPGMPVRITLQDYARFFFGPAYAKHGAKGLFKLEENWVGPLAENEGVEQTLELWRKMEKGAPDELLGNFRFQMGLLRANADVFLRRKLLNRAGFEKDGRLLHCRKRCDELAEALYYSIGLQSSVEKYHALAWNRGAFMDTLDLPLGELQETRPNPGNGGIYESFGLWGKKGRAVELKAWEEDPGFLRTPFITHNVGLLHLSKEEREKLGPVPLAWISNIHALYDTPLELVYQVKPNYDYILKVTYLSNFFGEAPITLMANKTHLVHDDVVVKGKVLKKEFPIPAKLVASGQIRFTWTTPPGAQGANIAELWLLRNTGPKT